MMIRRSTKEAKGRERERNAQAQSIAQIFTSHFRSAHSHLKVDPTAVKAQAKEDPASIDLTRKAIHFASQKLREASIFNVQITSGKTEVTAGLEGFRKASISSAAIRLNASTPFEKNQRVAKRSFDLNLSYAGGKFSLDSFERLGQVLPINKDSLRHIIALDDPSGENADDIKASETEPAATVNPHEGDDANGDVRRHAGEKSDDKKKEASCSGKAECGGKRKKGQFIPFGSGEDEEPKKPTSRFNLPQKGKQLSKEEMSAERARKQKEWDEDPKNAGKGRSAQASGRNPFQEGAIPNYDSKFDTAGRSGPSGNTPTTLEPEDPLAAGFEQEMDKLYSRIADLYAEGKQGEEITQTMTSEFPNQDPESISTLVEEEVAALQSHSTDAV